MLYQYETFSMGLSPANKVVVQVFENSQRQSAENIFPCCPFIPHTPVKCFTSAGQETPWGLPSYSGRSTHLEGQGG